MTRFFYFYKLVRIELKLVGCAVVAKATDLYVSSSKNNTKKMQVSRLVT